MNKFLYLFCCLITISCSNSHQYYTSYSIEDVVKKEDKMMGSKVSLFGYLKIDKNENLYSLHSSVESFYVNNSVNTIYLNTVEDVSNCNGLYVHVTGVVERDEIGLLSVTIASMFPYEEIQVISERNRHSPNQEVLRTCQISQFLD